MTTPYNLDEVQEYFEFTVIGHTYRFRHMTSEEMEEFKKVSVEDPEKGKDYMFQFITKIDSTSPDFSEIARKMIPPHWKKFSQMIQAEFNS